MVFRVDVVAFEVDADATTLGGVAFDVDVDATAFGAATFEVEAFAATATFFFGGGDATDSSSSSLEMTTVVLRLRLFCSGELSLSGIIVRSDLVVTLR